MASVLLNNTISYHKDSECRLQTSPLFVHWNVTCPLLFSKPFWKLMVNESFLLHKKRISKRADTMNLCLSVCEHACLYMCVRVCVCMCACGSVSVCLRMPSTCKCPTQQNSHLRQWEPKQNGKKQQETCETLLNRQRG